MSLPNRIAAYEDCLAAYDQALASGARVKFATKDEGTHFAFRMRQARALLREETKRVYPRDDPRWDKTDYDKLVVRGPMEDTEGFWWIYVELYGSKILGIEPLEAPTFGESNAS